MYVENPKERIKNQGSSKKVTFLLDSTCIMCEKISWQLGCLSFLPTLHVHLKISTWVLALIA